LRYGEHIGCKSDNNVGYFILYETQIDVIYFFIFFLLWVRGCRTKFISTTRKFEPFKREVFIVCVGLPRGLQAVREAARQWRNKNIASVIRVITLLLVMWLKSSDTLVMGGLAVFNKAIKTNTLKPLSVV